MQQLHGLFVGLLLLLPVGGQAEHGLQGIGAQDVVKSDPDVVLYRHFLKQPDVLKGTGNAHACYLAGRFARHGETVQHDGAPGGLIDSGKQVEHRSLPRPVGADQTGDLRRSQHHAHIVHGGQARKVHPQIIGFQNGLPVCIPLGYQRSAGKRYQLIHLPYPPSSLPAWPGVSAPWPSTYGSDPRSGGPPDSASWKNHTGP